MLSHIREQLHRENEEIVVKDFLDSLIQNQIHINIWVSRVVLPDGTRKTNINFLEPLKKETPNTEVVDDNLPI